MAPLSQPVGATKPQSATPRGKQTKAVNGRGGAKSINGVNGGHGGHGAKGRKPAAPPAAALLAKVGSSSSLDQITKLKEEMREMRLQIAALVASNKEYERKAQAANVGGDSPPAPRERQRRGSELVNPRVSQSTSSQLMMLEHKRLLLAWQQRGIDAVLTIQRCAKHWLQRSGLGGSRKPKRQTRRLSLVVEKSNKADVKGSRFCMHPSVFEMKFRGLEAYFGGLERYVGSPSPDILQAMERDHTSTEKFSSHNVFNTSPRDEFDYVVTMEVGERADRRADATPERYAWRLENFVDCDAARRAKLLREEVVGLRLYTGPMYVHYNNRVLRPGVQGSFVTTIHAINSAVVKLGKTQRALRVFRGLAGGVLPAEFLHENEMGTRGGVEPAFMSTSTNREVALEYATRQRGLPATLFEIKMGMIDKGADVSTFSQFPSEEEILFPPLTGLEVVDEWQEGDLQVLPGRWWRAGRGGGGRRLTAGSRCSRGGGGRLTAGWRPGSSSSSGSSSLLSSLCRRCTSCD